MIRLTLPLPPSINSYWRSATTRAGVTKVLISREGRRWKKQAGLIAQMQHGGAPLAGDVGLEIVAYFRDRRRDLDNILKPSLDLLQAAGIIENDRQVVRIVATRATDRGNPRVEIEITPLSRAAAA